MDESIDEVSTTEWREEEAKECVANSRHCAKEQWLKAAR